MTKKELEERIEELEEELEEMYEEREMADFSKDIKTAVNTTMAMVNAFQEKGLTADQAVTIVVAIISTGLGR